MADDIRNVVSSIGFVPENLIETSVFPNPTTGDFQVNFEKTDSKDWVLSLYGPLGRLLSETTINAPQGAAIQEVSLPHSANPGLYQFVIRNADSVVRASGKIILK